MGRLSTTKVDYHSHCTVDYLPLVGHALPPAQCLAGAGSLVQDPATPPMRGKRNRVIGYESVAWVVYNIIISGALPWALPHTANRCQRHADRPLARLRRRKRPFACQCHREGWLHGRVGPVAPRCALRRGKPPATSPRSIHQLTCADPVARLETHHTRRRPLWSLPDHP